MSVAILSPFCKCRSCHRIVGAHGNPLTKQLLTTFFASREAEKLKVRVRLKLTAANRCSSVHLTPTLGKDVPERLFYALENSWSGLAQVTYQYFAESF